MRAIVIQHEPNEGLGLLEPALREVGFELVRRFRDVEHTDLSAPLVVVLGGGMNVGDANHPFLAKEQAFLSERLATGGACLGVCLGSQLLAAAAGSQVMVGKNGAEIGVAPVRLTKAGAEDPVLAGLPQKLTVAHWHARTFTPVESAQLLASTDRYTQQIFRRGSSYGFQCHVELDAAAWLQWVEAGRDELRAAGRDVEALEKDSLKLKAAEPHLKRLCAQLAHHFAAAARLA